MTQQNLNRNFPIVDPATGAPNDYFMGMFQARAKDFDDTAATIAVLQETILGKADKTLVLTAGSGLTGGGDLSTPRTFAVGAGAGITVNADDVALSNTAVTPGAYTNANITVDQQGRLTAAANGSSGGGSGSITKIGTVTVTGAVAATVSFTGIPATYSDLLFYARHRGDNAAAVINFNLRFNNDSGANYDTSGVVQVNNAGPGGLTTAAATSMQIGVSAAAGAVNANKFGTTKGEIIQYANAAMEKSCITDSYDNCSNTIASIRWQRYAGDWRSTAAINRIDFIPSSGNWAIGTTFTLYGRS